MLKQWNKCPQVASNFLWGHLPKKWFSTVVTEEEWGHGLPRCPLERAVVLWLIATCGWEKNQFNHFIFQVHGWRRQPNNPRDAWTSEDACADRPVPGHPSHPLPLLPGRGTLSNAWQFLEVFQEIVDAIPSRQPNSLRLGWCLIHFCIFKVQQTSGYTAGAQ